MRLRCALINVENLFVLMDEEPVQDLKTMTSKGWKRLSSSTIPNKPLPKLFELAEAMRQIDADIYLLVEVGGKESLINFNQYFLADEYEPLLIEGNSDRAIDVGFLVRRSLSVKKSLKTNKDRKLKFLYAHEQISLESGYENLVKDKGQKFSRDVAELYVTGPHCSILFLLTHLKSKREGFQFDPKGGEKRKAELKGVIEIYKEKQNELGPNVPIFVCGDLNGNASRLGTEEEFKVIYESTGLEDLFELFSVPQEERITFHHIRGRVRSDQQLDYVLLDKGHKNWLAGAPFVFEYRLPGEGTKKRPPPTTVVQKLSFPSDHYPYVFEIQVPPPT